MYLQWCRGTFKKKPPVRLCSYSLTVYWHYYAFISPTYTYTWCHAVTKYFKNTLENNPHWGAQVDITQSVTMHAISKQSHAIASEGETTIVGCKLFYSSQRLKHGVLLHYKSFFFSCGAYMSAKATTEMWFVNPNLSKEMLISEREKGAWLLENSVLCLSPAVHRKD